MTQRHNFWSGLVVVVFSIVALAWIIPAYAGRATFASMPPDLLPRIAAWIMLISGLCVVATSVLELRRVRAGIFNFQIDRGALWWSLWPFLYVAACIWVMNYVKVIYVGAPMIAVMLILLGERRPLHIAGYAIIPVVGVYLLAVYLMRIGVV